MTERLETIRTQGRALVTGATLDVCAGAVLR